MTESTPIEDDDSLS